MERKKLWNSSILTTLSFSKKKKAQINMNLEVNIKNIIEEGKSCWEVLIYKDNSKYREDNFESFIFNLVRELDMAINAAVTSSKLEC